MLNAYKNCDRRNVLRTKLTGILSYYSNIRNSQIPTTLNHSDLVLINVLYIVYDINIEFIKSMNY